MDAQELRNLQEAYLEVYQEQELNEVHGRGRIDPYSGFDKHKESHSRTPEQSGLKMSPIDRATARENALRKRGNPEATKRANRIRSRFINPTERGLHRAISAGHTSYRDTKKRILDDQKESYDIYDIILSHLLDEGYAETPEAAEVIMVNMSEEWREGIIEEFEELDEEITPERRAQYKRGLKVRQANQETGFGKGRPRKRATSPQPGAQHYRKGMTQSHRDTMRDAAREENPERPEGSGSLPKGKKLERQRKTGVSAD